MGAAAHRLARHPAGPRDEHAAAPISRAGPLADPVCTNMGNPHATFFVADAEAVDLATLGPRLEHDRLFPERANIGVATVARRASAIRLRVWERGAGITRACGSGACAALVAAHRRGLTGRRATVALDGGELDIVWREDGRPRHHDRAGGAGLRGLVRRRAARPVTMMPGLEIITFGCRLNAFESEVIRGAAGRPGSTTLSSSTPAPSPPKPSARRGRRSAAPGASIPDARIIVTGCAATLSPERYAALAEVDLVLDNEAKLRPESYVGADPRTADPSPGGRGRARD